MKKIIVITTIAALITACHKDEDIIVYQTDTTIVNNYTFDPTFIIQDQQPVTDNITPATLTTGNKVAICAASNYVTEDEVSEGINILKSWGLEIEEADNLYLQDGRYAGTLGERVAAFQKAIDNPEIKAIFFARGGYGASQILPFINWEPLKTNPKWIIGYSDVSAIHITLNNLGIQSILGPMMRGFNKDKESINDLENILFNKPNTITLPTNSSCIEGTATGRLVGGNLSIIYSLSGTTFDLNTQNAILFIEDTGEANYSIDRMLLNLQQSGKLTDIKGLIVGEFINGTQGNDLPLPEIIKKYFGNLNIPILYGFPNGHDTQNIPIILGSQCTISIDKTEATVQFTAPEA